MSRRGRDSCSRLVGLAALMASAGGSFGCTLETPPIDGPPTWSTIYDDYFGPHGAASCGGATVGCHSRPDDAGAVVSNMLCVDKAGCYASITGASKLVTPADANAPASSKLIKDLRQAGGAGKMPKGTDFVFQPGDLERLEYWIQGGAKNN